MNSSNWLWLLFLSVVLASCGNGGTGSSSDFSIMLPEDKMEFQLGESLQIDLENKKSKEFDSVVYFLHNKRLGSVSSGEQFQYMLDDEKLGNWNLSARIYSIDAEQVSTKGIRVFNDQPPVSYTYNVVASYPHQTDAYTQGLEFYNDTLYESTGQYGESSLRKIDLESGKVLEIIRLDDAYFGEGLTILNDKIYQLTWKAGEGFIYDLPTMEREGSFAYNESKEGWGLANDGQRIFKSDGTEKIWILSPENLGEESYIQTLTHRTVATQLNELEWVEGKIYANTYQKDGVAIINPETGAVEGLINFQGLRDQLGNVDDLDPINDVLNGIAYNPSTGKLYVTGKKWDTLFEVEIVAR